MLNKNRRSISIILSVVISVVSIFAIAQAATTISSNISTGGTLAVTGASTLTGAVSASSTMQITGALTTYGASTFGDASSDVNLFTGTLQASTTALFTNGFTTYGNIIVNQSATTTLTFGSAGINFDANTFVVDPNANRVGILTATPNTALEVAGTASSTSLVVGGGSTVSGIVFGTCTYDGASITASTTLSTNCTGATGVRTTDKVFVTPRSLENGLIFTSASSTANDVIQVSVYNTGRGGIGGSIDPAAASWDWMAIR